MARQCARRLHVKTNKFWIMENIVDNHGTLRYNQVITTRTEDARGERLKNAAAPAIIYRNVFEARVDAMDELMLGDLVQMRKTHPCGSDRWTVIRVGADIKIRCMGCSRIVMMDRADFTKRMKKVLSHATEPIRGTNETDDI